MNPALRVWSLALLFCFAATIIIGALSPDGGGFIIVIFFIVALASVGSLIGFFLLFELLKQVSNSRWVFWIGSLVFVPVVVFLNAWLLMSLIDSGFSISRDSSGLEVLGLAAIPLAATILGMLASYKCINQFLSPES